MTQDEILFAISLMEQYFDIQYLFLFCCLPRHYYQQLLCCVINLNQFCFYLPESQTCAKICRQSYVNHIYE